MRQWADSAAFERDRAAAGVSIAAPTVVAVAAAMADRADFGTGRNVAVAKESIAAVIGGSTKTVQRAWSVLVAAGWAVERVRGHGGAATPSYGRRTSIYDLVDRREPARREAAPARPVGENVHLPPTGGVDISSPVKDHSPSARTRGDAESMSAQKVSQPRRAAQPRRQPRPLAVQKLAARVVAECPRLGRVHPGRVCDVLVGLELERCSAPEILAEVRAAGPYWQQVGNPVGFLAHRLRPLAAVVAYENRRERIAGPSVVATVEQAAQEPSHGRCPEDEGVPASSAVRASSMAQIREVLAAARVRRGSVQ